MVTMLSQLGDGDPVVREWARQNLMGMEASNLPELHRAISTIAPLTPGASQLIRDIVSHVFLSDDAVNGNPNDGFMGIAMGEDQIHSEMDDNAELPMGVLVEGRLPGFASYQMLRNGDVILGFASEEFREDAAAEPAGKPQITRVRTGEEIKALIGALPPGRLVMLTVLRSGRRLDVAFKLGARPEELELKGVGYQIYRQEQQRKADSYWQDNFASLVDQVHLD